MALDALKRISEAEQELIRQKDEASATARKAVAQAEQAGRDEVEAAREHGADQIKLMMRDAEATAASIANRILDDTNRKCADLRQHASDKVTQAAELIVERVVNG